MRPIKKPLSLNREIIRQLTAPELSEIQAAIQLPTGRCPSVGCTATQRHSCFDSCVNTDCCLEVP